MSNFPERIELSSHWHNTLDQMREESCDGRERGISVGFKEESGGNIFLAHNFVVGTQYEVFVPMYKDAKEKYGIEYQVGKIHSHPNNKLERLEWKVLEA